jgi:curli biogenesis system outer membrane secretion channel CsgG
MRRNLVVGAAAALALVAFSGLAEAQAKPKRLLVAVTDFDYGTVDNWWGQYDIGKGMADQVMNALVEDGTYRVVERKKLDVVLAEQDFAHSNRADPSAAKLSKIGKVLGVRYIITGSITKFSTESRGGSASVHGISLGGKKAKSLVTLTARLVDTSTGEVVLAAKGNGESGKGGGIGGSVRGVGAETHSEEWRTAGLQEAQEMACNELVKQIVAKRDRIEE